jgi:hypothetical protein
MMLVKSPKLTLIACQFILPVYPESAEKIARVQTKSKFRPNPKPTPKTYP